MVAALPRARITTAAAREARISEQASQPFMSDRSDKMSDGHMNDHRITVRFSPEMRRRLKAAARRSGTRESDLVRGAVELHLAAEEDSLTAYEHAKKAGLIGVVKGTTRDLSTNPRYFDGFGGS